MRVELLYPSRYLIAAELQDRDITLTIESVAPEELTMQGGVTETKPVLRFAKTKKLFVLNKTNAYTIAEMYGPETDDWAGKRVTLYPTRVPFGPDQVDAIRIRQSTPKQSGSNTNELNGYE